MANVVDSKIVVSQFELKSPLLRSLSDNILGESISPDIFPAMG